MPKVDPPPSLGVTPPQSAASADIPASSKGRAGGLNELLAAAGLPATHVSPELAADLGRILRVVAEGLLDLLHAVKVRIHVGVASPLPMEIHGRVAEARVGRILVGGAETLLAAAAYNIVRMRRLLAATA